MVRYTTVLVIYLQYDTVQYTTVYRPYSSYDYTSAILAAAGLTRPLASESVGRGRALRIGVMTVGKWKEER